MSTEAPAPRTAPCADRCIAHPSAVQADAERCSQRPQSNALSPFNNHPVDRARAISAFDFTARESFRLDWAALLRKLSAETPGTLEHRELVDRMVERVRSAILEVKEQSQKETEAWVTEFQSNLSQLEKDLKSQIDASRPGGIDVEVPDGGKADTPVEFSLDGMVAERFHGTVGSIGFVAPGLHRVTAKAQSGNRDFVASALVTVAPGQVCRVRLTLGIP